MGTGLYGAGGGRFVPKRIRPMNHDGNTESSDSIINSQDGDGIQPIIDQINSLDIPSDGKGGKGGKANNYAFANKLATKRFEFDMGKFLYQQAKDDAEAKTANDAIKLKKANADAQRAAMQKRFDSGEYAKGFEEQLAGLEQLGQDQQTNINSQRDSTLGEIAGGYDQAGNMVGTGFDQLTQYLNANPNNPYNDQTYGSGQVGNELSALLASQGTSNDPVNAQVQATQGGLDAGAQEFNNLNKMLSTIAQGSAGSRLSEAAIGKNQALTGLAQQRAGQEGSVKSRSADALSKMWANITENKIGVKANQAQAKSDLKDWLAENVSVGSSADDGNHPADAYGRKWGDLDYGKKIVTGVSSSIVPTLTPEQILKKLLNGGANGRRAVAE